MSLKDQVQEAMKTAMKAKDADGLRALRALKSMILLAETEEGRSGELTAADELKLVSKALKQRRESAATYQEHGRMDLHAIEVAEAAIIERFLPAQLSEAELEAKVKALIEEAGATSMKDMGKVMGAATKALAGQAEASAISAVVKRLLA
jgi:hypothetical protein